MALMFMIIMIFYFAPNEFWAMICAKSYWSAFREPDCVPLSSSKTSLRLRVFAVN